MHFKRKILNLTRLNILLKQLKLVAKTCEKVVAQKVTFMTGNHDLV